MTDQREEREAIIEALRKKHYPPIADREIVVPLADAVLPLVADAEQRGYERGLGEARAKITAQRAEIERIITTVANAVADDDDAVSIAQYAGPIIVNVLLVVLDSLRGGAG